MKKFALILTLVFALSGEAAASTVVFGNLDGAFYMNKYFSIGANFGDNWTLEFQKDYGTVLKADAKDGNSVLQVEVRDIGASTSRLPKSARDELVSSVLDQYMSKIRKLYGDMGVEGVKVRRMNVNFIGTTYPGFYAVGAVDGVPIYQKMVLVAKGSYLFGAMATSKNFDATESLLTIFHKIK